MQILSKARPWLGKITTMNLLLFVGYAMLLSALVQMRSAHFLVIYFMFAIAFVCFLMVGVQRFSSGVGREVLSVTFSGDSAERFQRLVDKTSDGNLKTTLREALRLYEAADKELDEGGEVIFRSKAGVERSAFSETLPGL